MKLLITGATGFVGTNFIQKMYKKYSIIAVVRQTSDTSKIDNYCQTYVYDNNLDNFVAFCKQQEVRGVLHLATLLSNSGHTHKEIDSIIESNITFGVKMLEVSKQAKIDFFINTSSTALYCNSDTYNPSSLYAATKKAFEDIITYYSLTSKTIYTNLVLFNIFGPNDNNSSLFSLLQKSLASKKCLHMSEGNQIVDYSHVYDIVEGLDCLIDNILKNSTAYENATYSLQGNERMSLRQFVALYEKCMGKKLNIKWGTKPKRELENMKAWDKGKKLPNWERKIGLIEGFKIML